MKTVKYDVAFLEEDDSIAHAYGEAPWTGTETTEFLAKAKETELTKCEVHSKVVIYRGIRWRALNGRSSMRRWIHDTFGHHFWSRWYAWTRTQEKRYCPYCDQVQLRDINSA